MHFRFKYSRLRSSYVRVFNSHKTFSKYIAPWLEN
jgi:hypothetical protein